MTINQAIDRLITVLEGQNLHKAGLDLFDFDGTPQTGLNNAFAIENIDADVEPSSGESIYKGNFTVVIVRSWNGDQITAIKSLITLAESIESAGKGQGIQILKISTDKFKDLADWIELRLSIKLFETRTI